MYLHEISEEYRDNVNRILKDEWHCPPLISRGRVIDTTNLPGFLFIEDKVIKGVITYNIENENARLLRLTVLKRTGE
ncbi:MAG: hypothetical protein ACOX4M_10620 [Acetivibrionales bacterium]|jgi:hypothetical protein